MASVQSVLAGAYVGLEAAAHSIRAYEQQAVPGLLQTEDYAKAMIRAARPDFTDDDVDQRVRVRCASSVVIETGRSDRSVGGA